MTLRIRPFTLEDAEVCGQLCYEAFKQIDEAHNFPASFESPEFATMVLASRAAEGFYSLVAELDGAIVGSNFLDIRSSIAGVGPISVDVEAQNASIGRQLMQAVLDFAAKHRLPGVRLTQSTYHNRSLSLYAKLGFVVREPLAVVKGPVLNLEAPGYNVRQMTPDDLAATAALCTRVHGFERNAELADALKGWQSPVVVERDGRITGYSTGLSGGHSVGESNQDIEAIIGAAPEVHGNGFLIPTRNAELFAWCLEHGLRVVQPMTLMSTGLYSEPAGAWLPSFLF